MPLKEKFDCQIDAFRNVKVLDDPAIKNDSELAKNLAKELAETPDLEKVLERERKLVVGEVEFAKKNEDLQTLLDYSLRVRAGPWEKSKAANILMLQAGELSTSARKVMLHETTFPNLLGPLIKDKTPAQQIYEVVKNKQEKIVKNKALLVTDPANRKDYQQKLDKLTSEFHEIIGAADEYYEILKLQRMIKTGPPKSADVGHSSPFQEYAAARAQLSALNEAVTLKLGKVAADAADPPPAKKAEWTPAPVEKAFCWNYSREKMELKTDPPPRILVPESSKKGPGPAERVATRVASEYGADINSWPKYVVVIGAIKKEEVKP